MKAHRTALPVATALLAMTGAAMAQTALPQPAPTVASQAPTSVAIYFDVGSSAIRKQEVAKLDLASRIFDDGKPIVMIVTGMADSSGYAGPNLILSQKRADVVFANLVARGLPPDHFQILAKGASDALRLSGQQDNPDQNFRKVEITWR